MLSARDVAGFVRKNVLPRRALFLAAAAFTLFFAWPTCADQHASSATTVLDLSLEGEVNPILATYIDEGLADAASRQAALVVITMDTKDTKALDVGPLCPSCPLWWAGLTRDTNGNRFSRSARRSRRAHDWRETHGSRCRRVRTMR